MTISPDLETRHAEFDQWVREVRDPAKSRSEGVRKIAHKRLEARYEMAELPDGRFAMTYSLRKPIEGHSIPWIAFGTRQEALNAFLVNARNYFSESSSMLHLLDEGLFGFQEPPIGVQES